MPTNQELYDNAMKAIVDLFGDRSVSQSEAKGNLNALVGEIQTMLDTLEDDE